MGFWQFVLNALVTACISASYKARVSESLHDLEWTEIIEN